MNLKIAIVENDYMFSKLFITHLENLLPKYFNEYTIIEILSNYSSNLKNNLFDLIFMDIDLQNISGIQLVSRMRDTQKNSLFVFVSSKNNMVFEALTVQPFQFIRKTNLLDDLILTLSLTKNYFESKKKLLTLELKGRKTVICINDVIYLETEGHYISIITQNDIYTYRSTLKNLLTLIDSKLIVQVQKSIAINLGQIKEVTNSYDIILRNSSVFSVNRFYKQSFIKLYKDYLLL